MTLTYEVTGPAANIQAHVGEVAWALSEGNRVVNWARSEFSRNSPELTPFNAKSDDIWRSQMGQPVKLSAEQLQLVAGGGTIKNIFVGVAAKGGAVAAGVAAAPIAAFTGEFIAPIVGNDVGKAVGDAVYGVFAQKWVWCFASQTLVATATGARAIESIVEGDAVHGYDDATGAVVETKVIRLDTHAVEVALNHVELLDGTSLSVTNGHPFLTLNRGWLFGEELRVGDELKTASGATVLVRAVSTGDVAKTTVYNVVTVAGTYLVGQAGVVCSGLTAAEAKARAIG